jgi:hypothetical protein
MATAEHREPCESRGSRTVVCPALNVRIVHVGQFLQGLVTALMKRPPPDFLADGRECLRAGGGHEAVRGDMTLPHRFPRSETVSRPAGLHHRPLAEPSVRLSPHSAPIRRTCRSGRAASVRKDSHFHGQAFRGGEGIHASGFDDAMFLNDASSKGSLSFVSRMLTCPRSSLSFSSNAHHHDSLPQQLGVV